MSVEHVVVWDGRKNGPGGAMLFGPESDVIDRPTIRPARGITDRLRAAKDRLLEWFTLAEAAQVTETTTAIIGPIIGNLINRGAIERKYQFARGQHVEQRYRWARR